MPKIKNILIFVGIGVVFILIYVLLIKGDPEVDSLVSSSSLEDGTLGIEANSEVTQEFLALLLSVKDIRLDDAIFSDSAFQNLRDSSIVLTPDGSEGRTNPFAPIGGENTLLSPQEASVNIPILNTASPIIY